MHLQVSCFVWVLIIWVDTRNPKNIGGYLMVASLFLPIYVLDYFFQNIIFMTLIFPMFRKLFVTTQMIKGKSHQTCISFRGGRRNFERGGSTTRQSQRGASPPHVGRGSGGLRPPEANGFYIVSIVTFGRKGGGPDTLDSPPPLYPRLTIIARW